MRTSTGGACHPLEKSQDAASGCKLLQEKEMVSTELQGVMKELRALREAKEQLGAKVEELQRSLMAAPPALEPPAKPLEQDHMKMELRELRQQLAQMQDSVLRLTEENHQLASVLQSEQLEKKALARKLGQLQEKLLEITAMMALKSQEAQQLQQQGAQLLSQVWQHAESWQQLAMEKETLCKRILLHRNLAMQLQDREEETVVALDRIRQEMQEDLTASRLEEEQAAPLRVLALAGAGDMKQRPVEAPVSNTTIPEDSGSSEALEHQAPLPRGLRQQNGQRQHLAHLAAVIQDTSAEGAPTPRMSGDRVTTGKLQEDAAIKERVREPEHHCLELREEPGDTELAAIFPRELVVRKEEGHQEEEEEEEEEEKEQGEEAEEKQEQNKEEDEEEEREKQEKEKEEKEEDEVEDVEEEVKEEEEVEEEKEEKQYDEEENAEREEEEEKQQNKEEEKEKEEEEVEEDDEVEEEKEEEEEEEEKEEQNKEKEQGEEEKEEEEEEVEEDEDAEEETEWEKQQYSSQLCPGQEVLQQVALRQDDGRSCQGQLVATTQTRGEEPTAGPRGTWDITTSAADGEGSPAHSEEPTGEEAQVGSSPQPQLPESENPIRAQAWVFIPSCPAWGFATSLRKRTPHSSV